MALVNGSDYDHIDLHSAAGGDVTRHMLKDAQARGDVSDLKSALSDVIDFGAFPGNLIDPNDYIKGSYINTNTGEVAGNGTLTNYFCTGFISVTAGETYRSNKGRNYAWYNSSKEYISGADGTTIQAGIIAPPNAAYLRFSVNITSDGINTPYLLYLANTTDFSTTTIFGIDIPVIAESAAETVSNDLAALDNAIFDSTPIDYTTVNTISGATYKTGSASRSTSYITIDALTTYDSYYKVVTEPTTIWFEDTESAYVSLCVGESYTESTIPSENVLRLYCSNSVRYRKSESNLPTRANPVTVPAGGVYVVTVTAGGRDLIYGTGNTVEKTVKASFAEDVADAIALDSLTVVIGTSTVKITGKNYEVTFEKKSTTQGYQWNITSLTKPGGSNVLPTSTDIIGPIQYDGENNFMGGVHGNESNFEFSLWSEGAQITTSGAYKNVRVWMASHLYSVNDPTVNMVDRFVEMNFNESGWRSRNTFKIVVAGTVKVSYASGLFGWNRSDVNFAVCNLGAIDLASEERQYYKHEFKQVIVNFTDKLTVTFRSDTASLGFVTYRSSTSSYKAYYADTNNQAVSVGDYITGECEYVF